MSDFVRRFRVVHAVLLAAAVLNIAWNTRRVVGVSVQLALKLIF